MAVEPGVEGIIGADITLLLAFGAGLLSFASPCVLPLVPVYLAHLAGAHGANGGDGQARTLGHALSFVAGFSLVFIVLGASIGFVGFIVRDQLPLLQKIAGVFLVLLGLHLLGVMRIPVLERTWKFTATASPGVSLARSFGVGAAFSTGWTPCIGPILGAILALAATSETALKGATLLGIYSLGLAIPFLVAAVALDWWTRAVRSFNSFLRRVEMVSGAFIIIVGLLIFTNSLTLLNQYFDFFGLGAGI